MTRARDGWRIIKDSGGQGIPPSAPWGDSVAQGWRHLSCWLCRRLSPDRFRVPRTRQARFAWRLGGRETTTLIAFSETPERSLPEGSFPPEDMRSRAA
jgi:hypothetical protein